MSELSQFPSPPEVHVSMTLPADEARKVEVLREHFKLRTKTDAIRTAVNFLHLAAIEGDAVELVLKRKDGTEAAIQIQAP